MTMSDGFDVLHFIIIVYDRRSHSVLAWVPRHIMVAAWPARVYSEYDYMRQRRLGYSVQ